MNKGTLVLIIIVTICVGIFIYKKHNTSVNNQNKEINIVNNSVEENYYTENLEQNEEDSINNYENNNSQNYTTNTNLEENKNNENSINNTTEQGKKESESTNNRIYSESESPTIDQDIVIEDTLSDDLLEDFPF